MIKIIKAVEGNTDYLTSQSFVYPVQLSTPNNFFQNKEEESSKTTKCNLFITISASSENVFNKVRQVGLTVRDKFLELDNLPLKERLSETGEFFKQQFNESENLQVLLGVNIGELIYMQNYGNAEIYLINKDKLVNLTDNFEKGELFSGKLKNNSRLLIISSRLIDSINFIEESYWKTLPEKLIKENPDELNGEIEMFLHDLNLTFPIAVIMLENGELESKVEEFSSPVDYALNKSVKIAGYKNNLIEFLNESRQFINKIFILFREKLFKKKKIRNQFILITFILIVIVAGIFIYYQRNHRKDSQFEIYFKLAEQKINQAENLKYVDIKEAKTALNQSRVNINYALAIKPKDVKASKLKSDIEEKSYEILKVNRISNFPIYLSLDLIKKKF